MDINFTDPSEVPLPPDEIRITELRAEAWPDGRRVKISLSITPFQKRPNAELIILDGNGNELAQASIIESIERHMELTLHMRGPELIRPFSLQAELFYTDIEEQLDPQQEARPINRTVVDNKQIMFDLR
jgi:hypothetical protein